MTASALKKRRREKEEFKASIREVLKNKSVQSMRKFNHHSDTTCHRHCMHVAYYNYKICKFLGLDKKAAAKAGMLHDLFLYDWHTHSKETGEKWHGFTHPRVALMNAKKNFDINDKEKDIILKHMWPLTVALPKYKETYVIVFTDKFCGFCEVMDKYVRKFV